MSGEIARACDIWLLANIQGVLMFLFITPKKKFLIKNVPFTKVKYKVGSIYS